MFNVVLLAAGYATRLYPLTENFPKPLLDVADKTIVNHFLDRLAAAGSEIGEVICVTNDRYAEHFEKWKNKQSFSFPIKVINDGTRTNETRLGAVRDVQLGIQALKMPGDLMVVAGDNIFDSDLGEFVKNAKTRKDAVTLACIDVEDKELAKKYGILKLGKAGKVDEFCEKPSDPPSTLASTGIYYFPKSTLSFFEKFLNEKGSNPDAPGFYIKWLVDQIPVYGEPLNGIWYDIGDKQSLEEADKIFRRLEGAEKK